MRAATFSLLLCGALLVARGAQPVKDETKRISVLSAIFPGMQITPGDPYPQSKPRSGELIVFPDALAGQRVYRVVGTPSGEAENCASEDVATSKRSDVRELRFLMYPWPGGTGLLAVVQYDFKFNEGGPAGSCWSVGRILHLTGRDNSWQITSSVEISAQHHAGLQRIELADFDGDGSDELLVESDWGGAGTVGSSFQVFSLRGGHFERWLGITSKQESGMDGSFTQVLDLKRTRAAKGMQFCFTRTDLGAEGELFRHPRVSKPCYPRGTIAEP